MFIPEDTELLTHKAGKWKFSAQCDQEKVYPLLVRAETLYEAVLAIPTLPEWQAQLTTELTRRSIHGTAAIEGNPLSLNEVAAELQQPAIATRAQREIVNLGALYAHLQDAQQPRVPLSEALVKKFHAILMDGIVVDGNQPGHYRTTTVKVGDAEHGGVHTPPRILKDIADLMAVFMQWFNGSGARQLHPMLRAACAHYYLARIHPFRDGNGRTARFAEAYVLAQNGMELVAPMLANYYHARQDDYFSVFSETARGDMTPFFCFVLAGIYESLKTVQREIFPLVGKLLMADVIRHLRQTRTINGRQQALLEIMLDNPAREASPESLFADPSFSGHYAAKVSRMTARRDLAKLRDMGLLVPGKSGLAFNLGYLTRR